MMHNTIDHQKQLKLNELRRKVEYELQGCLRDTYRDYFCNH